ncbi:hypothetical protein MKX34_26525 [Paenibacillus sp. FSL R5-0636]|uniref:hypothetical protein n=1 Tax=Paenibacillus TaxID=44249 RepID=UPI00096FE02E|nr:hypothetical protein [Paenibacillus odorifer]OMC99145.1 hypothetical protein BJP49_29910 [Paenibacillus odorifer]
MTRFVGIDPATTTGFVALDEEGNVLVETDLRGEGKREPGGISIGMLVSLENKVYGLLKPGDIIAIEKAAFKTDMGVTTGMIHGGLRTMILRKGLNHVDINVQHTKKFVNRNQRVPHSEKKSFIAAGVLEHYDYAHKSDNVTDAYIIARIAQALHQVRNGHPLDLFTSYQQHVIRAILYPDETPTKPKSKSKTNKRTGKPAAAGSHAQNTEQTCLF